MNTFFSDSTYTYAPTDVDNVCGRQAADLRSFSLSSKLASRMNVELQHAGPESLVTLPSMSPISGHSRLLPSPNYTASLSAVQHQTTTSSQASPDVTFSRTMIPNQQSSARRTIFHDISEPPVFSQNVETLLQQYYQQEPLPNDQQNNFIASNLGIEVWHVCAWFHHQRERDIVSQQFQKLKMGDLAPTATQGARMILPYLLNKIIEILPPGRTLLIDLRPPANYEKSHIRGAINLRAPLRFVQDASFDMIERAFSDRESRQKFGEWQSTMCMVFYARAVDSPWECPVAGVLYEKFKSWGWPGRCFILKGHYREFSVSYSKPIHRQVKDDGRGQSTYRSPHLGQRPNVDVVEGV
ncbi:hypothetical protein LY78DRAFT_82441 [Colletotrichum sublineola]|nr:hypothetical protein LY78DRAFT_82441 [Colletotrichum sublineola]